ncbi:MAG: phosphatidylglycerol lysyltransferase [Spirochaetaceae bacterium]|jgi:phosphoglucomutase|nr:phosphatidylglycerol lysyltransferase [Spirochaetaceae bacterium]
MLNPRDPPLTEALLTRALAGMILSSSGWRGIFAASGDEEDPEPELSPPCGIIAAAGAAVFADFLKTLGAGPPVLILGRDTRPTGKETADLMLRAFLGSGCTLRYTGIAAAPEIMAYARAALGPGPGGFCYISASHNPIGHNGLKFGLNDGGVLGGAGAEGLIRALGDYLKKEDPIGRVMALLNRAGEDRLREVYREEGAVKQEALRAYRLFSRELIAGSAAEQVLGAMAGGLAAHPLGIAADFNGSARTVSIDREFCQSLGIRFNAVNGAPGEIVHGIIPEGPSLEQCRRLLEDLHARDPSFLLGYVPDCDGDRGNLVVWDGGGARPLEAQEVFALSCAAELAHLVWTGELRCHGDRPLVKAAVAVNGPTSLRIDRIAEAFGVRVFRAEVGEANVVNLARRLRNEGYLVRILGEGSNGGNITHPSAVRDPLATIFALVKLLTIRRGSGPGDPRGLFDIWRERAIKIRQNSEKNPADPAKIPQSIEEGAGKPADYTLSDIIASLPSFATTPVSAPEAKLRISTGDHALLKEKYQGIFKQEWNQHRDDLLTRWGIADWEGRACIGSEELRNLSRFGCAQTGGLRVVFKNRGGREIAFIWMRGSRTEPVFRIMADAEGSPELERTLIRWQQSMVIKADAEAGVKG